MFVHTIQLTKGSIVAVACMELTDMFVMHFIKVIFCLFTTQTFYYSVLVILTQMRVMMLIRAHWNHLEHLNPLGRFEIY